MPPPLVGGGEGLPLLLERGDLLLRLFRVFLRLDERPGGDTERASLEPGIPPPPKSIPPLDCRSCPAARMGDPAAADDNDAAAAMLASWLARYAAGS